MSGFVETLAPIVSLVSGVKSLVSPPKAPKLPAPAPKPEVQKKPVAPAPDDALRKLALEKKRATTGAAGRVGTLLSANEGDKLG